MQTLTAHQVAEILRVPVARVYGLARGNALPGVLRLGKRQVRFDERALRDFVTQGTQSPNQDATEMKLPA